MDTISRIYRRIFHKCFTSLPFHSLPLCSALLCSALLRSVIFSSLLSSLGRRWIVAVARNGQNGHFEKPANRYLPAASYRDPFFHVAVTKRYATSSKQTAWFNPPPRGRGLLSNLLPASPPATFRRLRHSLRHVVRHHALCCSATSLRTPRTAAPLLRAPCFVQDARNSTLLCKIIRASFSVHRSIWVGSTGAPRRVWPPRHPGACAWQGLRRGLRGSAI